MDIPDEFRQFGSQFFQGFERFVDPRNDDEMIRYALEQVPREQQVALKKFLTELLNRKPSAETLAGMWEATGNDFYIYPGLDEFLAKTCDAIPD